MRNNLQLLCVLTVALATAAWAQTPAPPRPLTEAELLKQINSLNAGSSESREKAPAAVARVQSNAKLLPGFKDSLAEKKSVEKKDKKDKKTSGPTEITALEATFDQKNHLAVFTGEVIVKNPDFDLSCDRLTAYLKHDDAAGTAGEQPQPAAAGGAEKKSKGGGLERAVAEGNVVIIQDKPEADGALTRSTGRSQKAIYDAGTGETTLIGKPEVQKGINTIVATDESTIMIMTGDGNARVKGPHRTVIRDKVDEK